MATRESTTGCYHRIAVSFTAVSRVRVTHTIKNIKIFIHCNHTHKDNNHQEALFIDSVLCRKKLMEAEARTYGAETMLTVSSV